MESVRRPLRLRPATPSDKIASSSNSKIGAFRKILTEGLRSFSSGSKVLFPVVYTITVAVFPWINELGLMEHVLKGAVVAQLSTTLKEKPPTPVKLIAFL